MSRNLLAFGNDSIKFGLERDRSWRDPSKMKGEVVIISLTLYGYCICQFYIPSVWSFTTVLLNP